MKVEVYFQVTFDFYTPMPIKDIKEFKPVTTHMTQEEYNKFYDNQMKEYGNVWRMPKPVRDIIRDIKLHDGSTPLAQHQQAKLPLGNTGVGKQQK